MRSILRIFYIFLLAAITQDLVSQQVQATSWTDSTLLPLVIISTHGQEIPDEPRIEAHMGLVHNDRGLYNTSGDPYTAYDGQISIELRGESSLYYYDKKSFSMETQNADGSNNNVSLLGLPEENDWVLQAPFGDKSLMRNVLSYSLFEKFGHYAPRTRFVELILNGDYQGVYVLTEKIKRDKNRVDMAKITAKDTTAEDISGGYLLRIDKTSDMEPHEYWESPVEPPIVDYNKVVYQYFDPEYDEMTSDQRSYIRNYLLEFEQSLVSSDYKDPLTGYRAYLDIPSFIDLMILNEFVKDVDAFRLSHYFYKQKDNKGGKLVSGPPWDYNLTFGNSDFTPSMHLTGEWIHTSSITIYWWARIMWDSWFKNQLYCRWDELYAGPLSHENMSARIDSSLEVLGLSVSRNFERWPILGTYVWPNSYVGLSYEQEMDFLRNWIGDRLDWMDWKWGGKCLVASEEVSEAIERQNIKVFPNPSDLSNSYVSLSQVPGSKLTMSLYNLSAQRVYHAPLSVDNPELLFPLPDLSFLPAGIYTLEITDGQNFRELSKVLKH
jgi:hypothetical protein